MTEKYYNPDNNMVRAPKYVCGKHGEIQFAFKTDQRSFCPKCVADHMEKEIGLARIEQ